MATVRCEFESHLFDGFQTEINLINVETIDEIIALSISILYSTLKMHNLKGLISHLDYIIFKINETTMDDIKKNPDKIVIIKENDEDSSESD